jgi:uncharacterized protein (DUF433 family)
MAENDEVELAPRIVVSKRVRFGRPVIRGTRVPVDRVVGELAGGMSFEQVMAEYGLEREDILAALRYAADLLAGEEIRAS